MTHDMMTFVAELLINETTEQINITKEITGTDTYQKNLKASKMKQQNYWSITSHFKLVI